MIAGSCALVWLMSILPTVFTDAPLEIIESLKPADLKCKMAPESVQRILAEGGVTEHKDSVWPLDFWGKKTVAGILLMPITRHQILHLNDSMSLKQKIQDLK